MNDTSVSLDKDGFVARAARPTAGRYLGAAIGRVDPGRIARRVLGHVHYGALMVYCFRRFGPPNAASDPLKDVCAWILTTPMEGLFLSVVVKPHETEHLFAYLASEALARELGAAEHARDAEYRERWRRFCRKITGEDPPLWESFERGGCAPGSDEYRALRARHEELWATFQASGPGCAGGFPLRPAGSGGQAAEASAAGARPDAGGGRLWDAALALEVAIADLRRPVLVRDVAIDCCGPGDSRDGAVEPFHAAGYVFPVAWLDDHEAYVDLLAEVDRAGGPRAAADALGDANGCRRPT